MTLRGLSLIGSGDSAPHAEVFYGVNPATGERLQPPYVSSTTGEVAVAAELAATASASYGRLSGVAKAAFLCEIAKGLETGEDAIVVRAQQETALPEARLKGELARTTNQLRLFATLVEEGSWVDARIDTALLDRQPLPRPSIRSMLRSLGPVAVFGSSNFPLAFSVAGGDTASALAAGCPVIVKAHPAHPGTGELVATVIRDAVRSCGLPEGVFSLLYDAGLTVARELVTHPAVKAVGFTGSLVGGSTLMQIAASRPSPIPVYAEMGSVNPLFILPEALRSCSAEIATALYNSFTLGSGQFCTKPGMVFVPKLPEAEKFIAELIRGVDGTHLHAMLTADIAARYATAVRERQETWKESNVQLLADSRDSERGGCEPRIALFSTDVGTLLSHPQLAEEIFGPSTLLVHYNGLEDLLAAVIILEGHLTATIHGTVSDLANSRDLVAVLEAKVGRLLINGFPTGVEVCHAMVHGGPYPATSDGRSTSVGTRAILRFTRPVCYQNFPNEALPEELQDGNPRGIFRMVDGVMTR